MFSEICVLKTLNITTVLVSSIHRVLYVLLVSDMLIVSL